MKQQYQLKNAMLMMALAAAYPMQSFAAAGIAQFSAGDVTLRRGAATDTLTKGKNIESGDAIVTGANGRAQVRFSDGGLVSLQPNSQFNIANYADRNDPKQDAFLVDLLRGGMRAVTGLIGKRNRDNREHDGEHQHPLAGRGAVVSPLRRFARCPCRQPAFRV